VGELRGYEEKRRGGGEEKRGKRVVKARKRGRGG